MPSRTPVPVSVCTLTFLLITLISSSAGTVSISDAAPTGDILSSNNSGGTWTNLFDEDRDGNHARGQLFSLPATTGAGYEITSITVHKNGNQTFAEDTLTLHLFEGTQEDWEAGSGHNFAIDGSNYFIGTTVTPLHTEAFTLDGRIENGDYVTFHFETPVVVNDDSDFGFLMTYDEAVDGGGGASPDFFRHNEGTSGLRISITTDEHIVTMARHIRHFIGGTELTIDPTADDDEDGLADFWELQHFGDLDEVGSGDPDGDELNNEAEETAGTDPNDNDSDDDGLDDAVEVAGPTDPLDADSDDDNLLDGVESGSGVYLSSSNTGTDPLLADSDNDGLNDDIEIRLGSDPFDDSHLPAQRPNIIFIMIDDADVQEIGVYGQATLLTPRVDAMAAEGMLFTDYYTASPVCHSCRSSLMTGQDSRRAQDRYNNGDGIYQVPLAADRVTIGEVLKEAGYTTGCVGKWGMGGPTTTGAPWNQGFDFFCGYLGQVMAHDAFPKYLWKNDQRIYFNEDQLGNGDSLYIEGAENFNTAIQDWDDPHGNVSSHDVVVAEGLQFIEDNADGPFFLYCAWTPPHAHNFPAATVDALTDEDGLIYDTRDLDQTLINEMYPGSPFGPSSTTPGYPDYETHTYASMLSAADRDAGRIIDKLIELGIEENTLVIFSSDNGESGDSAFFLTPETLKPGHFDLRGAKKDTYEGGIRAPFIAWWPGTVPANSTSDTIGTFADLLPTFADMAGISSPPQVTGRSILPVLQGASKEALQPRDYHYWSFREASNGLNRRWRAVRQGDWKIVRDRVNDGRPPTYELFNLATDQHETTDLSLSEPDKLAQLIPLVEGTHEVPNYRYFRADDEFFTKSNLTASAAEMGVPDGSGSENGYTLTPSGVGSGFNYLPFSDGINEMTTFTWSIEFPSGGAASLLLGEVNEVSQCLAVRIESATRELSVSYQGSTWASTTLDASDLTGNRAESALTLEPASGRGSIRVGSTILPFEGGVPINPLRFWGYEVESAAINASRPRWAPASSGAVAVELKDEGGHYAASYRIPFTPGQTVTTQYSTDLQTWHDHPPGLIDTRSTSSQGELLGTWTLSKDSLLPRSQRQLYLRSKVE
ncbi:MAG: sulfatase-like hydrolase/transferase [Verrucomicrobiota bacterium JB023]|nr:sulfatase-like hydrolase/transferase [Verrucomicrobiota bacterium JB023]